MVLRNQNMHGLVLSSGLTRLGLNASSYQRAVSRGELVRVRRGAYCDAAEWSELSSRERYLLKMRAVAMASTRPPIFCGYSAAAIWGMPIPADWPTQVHVVAPVATGGRSRHGVVRHPIAHAVKHVANRHGFGVTDVAGTAADMALALPFSFAVGCVDWALWNRNEFRVTREAVGGELSRRDPRYRRRHAEAVLRFATELSDSFGESMARAVMIELGFESPQLQVRFRDELGEMVVDYFWPEARIAGEFDGKSKYLRPSYGAEMTPGEIVWREKKREDRLRRLGYVVVRIIWADLEKPGAVAAKVRSAIRNAA